MSSIKIGVHEFKFNELAIREFSKILLEDMARGLEQQELAISSVYAMLWGGLQGNAYVKRIPFEMTFEQVCDLAESMEAEDLKAISDVFVSVQAYKDLLSKVNDAADNEKKKNTKPKKK